MSTLLICGSRNVVITTNDIDTAISYIFWTFSEERMSAPWSVTRVISGGATGPDTVGEEWAKERGLEYRKYMARWESYGKTAGILRNKIMVKQCHFCLAFWDGKSKGTEFTINYAAKLGKKVYVVLCNDSNIGEPKEFALNTEW